MPGKEYHLLKLGIIGSLSSKQVRARERQGNEPKRMNSHNKIEDLLSFIDETLDGRPGKHKARL